MIFPTRHVLLRDRRAWLGTRTGLAIDRDGALTLARVPAAATATDVATAYPYARALSGIVAGPCDAVFVADTAHDRILYVDGLCDSQAWVGGSGSAPGRFSAPRGLVVTLDDLRVADSGNGRIASLALPGLEAHLADASPRPTALALDHKGRLVFVDAAQKRVLRDDHGTPDAAFAGAVAASGHVTVPVAVACGRDDGVLVSDLASDEVVAFDASGAFVRLLPLPPGALPGALAADDLRTCVADAASGAILLFDADGGFVGPVPGYRGPVTALALDGNGNLYVKPGLDERYVRLAADAAFVATGTVSAGPFDAGERTTWERVWVDADVPAGTRVTMRVASADAAAPAPPLAAYVELTTGDALLSQVGAVGRYLWFDVGLATSVAARSPRIAQIRAATPAEDYLDYLPSTYARNDAAPGGADGFLSRLLKLVRGEQGALEEDIDRMPRVADPAFATPDTLPWLAQWLGLELPQIADDTARRELVEHAVALFARRGTPQSIAALVALHTGIRPTIVEAFEGRALWVLGATSRLGFDTRLPALDPFGMVVPDEAPGQCCSDDVDPEPVCRRDARTAAPATVPCATGPVGRAVVGESGPLAEWQIGVPLFAEEAYRFCVVVDAYRVRDPATLAELHRIVEREKPAHTDYRVQLLEPEMRVGYQARIGIDAIVGGPLPGFALAATVGVTTRVEGRDASGRVGQVALGDVPLILT